MSATASPGLPPRQIPYAPDDVRARWGRIQQQDGGPSVHALILDTSSTRLVSFWSDDALEGFARGILEYLDKPQIVVADLDDLRGLV